MLDHPDLNKVSEQATLRVGFQYLSKGTFPHSTMEVKMIEIDFRIKVDGF